MLKAPASSPEKAAETGKTMDKPRIREAIVVEGRDDTINLKRAVDCFTIETHGFGIKRETWEAIEKAYNERGIIIFTDPDYSGEEIRRRLKEAFPEAAHAYLMREDALKKGDIGVENAEPEAIREALRKCHAHQETGEGTDVTMSDLDELGLTGGQGSRELRQLLGKELGIGYANGRGLLRKLAGFGIGKEELYEAVRTIDHKRDQR